MIYSGAISFDKPVDPIRSFRDLDYPYKTEDWMSPEGHTISFGAIGKGEHTVLFLHGLGSYGPAWVRLAEALPQTFRSILPDWPGHGHSPLGDFKISSPHCADLIRSLIGDMDWDCPLLAGHGMGGQIALQFALDYPGSISGLLLVAPWGLESFSDKEQQLLLEAYDPTRMRMSGVQDIQENFGIHFYSIPEEAAFLLRHRYQMRYATEFPQYCRMLPEYLQAMLDRPVKERIKEIELPVLCAIGRADQLIPNAWLHGGSVERLLEEVFEDCKNVRTEIIGRAGHFVPFERPELLAKLIVEWYETLS